MITRTAHLRRQLYSGIFFLFFVVGLITGGLIHYPARQKASAQASSCTVTVTPSTMTQSETVSYSFTIENTDSVDFDWFRVTRPHSEFSLSTTNISGWGVSSSTSSTRTFEFGELLSGEQLNFTMNATSGTTDVSGVTWTVEVSDAGGDDPYTCTGSLAAAISGAGPDSTPPTISSVAVSDVSNTGATISWSTDERATSYVEYGLNDDYGLNESSAVYTSVHSITLTGLSANTTYHFNIQGTDEASNTGESGDLTFVTAATQATSTPYVITSTPKPTGTPTGTPTATPTPTPIPDTQAPVVTLNELSSSRFDSPPKLHGKAIDDRDVSSFEYTVDNGRTWRRIDEISGLGSKVAQFGFVPEGIGHGHWEVSVRARDTAQNVGRSNAIAFDIDTVGPHLQMQSSIDSPFPEPPELVGTAYDEAGESAVDYSLDDGKNWLPVDSVARISDTVTEFRFRSDRLDDGNYPLKLRGRDRFGNQSEQSVGTVIIDRLPPRIGGNIVLNGPQASFRDSLGVITTSAGTYQKIIVSTVGGVIEQELEIVDLQSGETYSKDAMSPNKEKGLWFRTFAIDRPGLYQLRARAIDGAGGVAEKTVSFIHVLESGIVKGDATALEDTIVTLYVLDKFTGKFVEWNGFPYEQQNPQRIDTSGFYTLHPGAGTYYLEVSSSGHKRLRTHIFTLKRSRPIVFELELEKSHALNLFGLEIPMVSLEQTVVPVTKEMLSGTPYDVSLLEDVSTSSIGMDIAQEASNFLGDIRGKMTVMTILNSWMPQAPGQLEVLAELAEQNPDINVIVLFPHESDSRVALYRGRGKYDMKFVADPDGELGEKLSFDAMPMHYVIDQSGFIKYKETGVLTNEALLGTIEKAQAVQ